MVSIQGAITALVTPFKDGAIDTKAFQSFVEWQIDQGIHGLVPAGTTGESATLTHEEHGLVIALCVEAAKGRVPVIAGTGSNSTLEAIALTQHAKDAGADAALIATPYYNKPNQEGLYQHYKAIAQAVDIPIVLYNIPGRSVVDMHDTTIARLAEFSNIIGLKDATGDLARVSSLQQFLDREFILLSGEDATAVGFNAQGGRGCISVTANIAPAEIVQVQEATLQQSYDIAHTAHQALMGLHEAMFCDSSPAPAKYAAGLMGKMSGELRLPLVELTENKQAIVKRAMQQCGLV